MLDLQVGVEGRLDLQARLNLLKAKASRSRLERALRAGGEVFKEAIEDGTPVRTPGGSGDALPPGALKRDIHVKVGSTLAGRSEVTVGPGNLTAHVMRWLEWGHNIVSGGYLKLLANGRKRGHGKTGGFVPALGIMRRAYESSRDDATRAVISDLSADE